MAAGFPWRKDGCSISRWSEYHLEESILCCMVQFPSTIVVSRNLLRPIFPITISFLPYSCSSSITLIIRIFFLSILVESPSSIIISSSLLSETPVNSDLDWKSAASPAAFLLGTSGGASTVTVLLFCLVPPSSCSTSCRNYPSSDLRLVK